MSQRERAIGLCALGLQKVAGQCLLLDAELRIVGGTPRVSELLGGQLPLGVRAPAVLCGENEKRPLAEALARGESVAAEIARLTPQGEHMLSVRSVPLKEHGAIRGHLLLLALLGAVHEGVTESAGIVTASESMRSLIRQIEKVAPSDASVLVRGETGSGKELVARALHAMSPRKDKPFVAINCAALPADLLESELFGHERGAFTGAVRENLGLFRQANGGTIFLDEVAELPLAMQAKLLRVTQERTVLPVGSTTPVPVDVRLVSATHRSLREAVQEGKFRADLMFRLRVIPLFLPPLRERPDDVELLAKRLVASLNASSSSRKVESISEGAVAALRQHSWPGNVRELQNVLEYAFLLGEGPVLSEADLPDEVRGSGSPEEALPRDNLSALSPEARRIHRALERAGGHRGRAAESLGMSRATLWRKMKQLDLKTVKN